MSLKLKLTAAEGTKPIVVELEVPLTSIGAQTDNCSANEARILDFITRATKAISVPGPAMARNSAIRSSIGAAFNRDTVKPEDESLSTRAIFQHGPESNTYNRPVDALPPSKRKRTLSTSKRGPFQMFLKTLEGAVTVLQVSSDTTVEGVKQLYSERFAIPPGRQRLVFAGKQLEDHMTLEEYGVHKGATVHVVLSLSGS